MIPSKKNYMRWNLKRLSQNFCWFCDATDDAWSFCWFFPSSSTPVISIIERGQNNEKSKIRPFVETNASVSDQIIRFEIVWIWCYLLKCWFWSSANMKMFVDRPNHPRDPNDLLPFWIEHCLMRATW
jgi:hypothetical protein